jgi:hypothetical protein
VSGTIAAFIATGRDRLRPSSGEMMTVGKCAPPPAAGIGRLIVGNARWRGKFPGPRIDADWTITDMRFFIFSVSRFLTKMPYNAVKSVNSPNINECARSRR